MKYLDKGVLYIAISNDTTKEEMNLIKEQYKNQTVVFIRSGQTNMKIILTNLLNASMQNNHSYSCTEVT